MADRPASDSASYQDKIDYVIRQSIERGVPPDLALATISQEVGPDFSGEYKPGFYAEEAGLFQLHPIHGATYQQVKAGDWQLGVRYQLDEFKKVYRDSYNNGVEGLFNWAWAAQRPAEEYRAQYRAGVLGYLPQWTEYVKQHYPGQWYPNEAGYPTSETPSPQPQRPSQGSGQHFDTSPRQGLTINYSGTYDLGGYGAPGFAWNAESGRVWAINQDETVGSASTLQEAIGAAASWARANLGH